MRLISAFYGMFERLIRSTKRCLKKVLFKSYLTYEQLLTVLLQIEVIINNRPLTFIYEKPGDEPLTPNHLLLGRKLNLEAVNETEINENLNAQNNYIVTVLDHYWKRWRSEYITELREYHKQKNNRNKEDSDISVDSVVLVQEDKLPRTSWTVGVVTKLIISSDGKCRSVILRHVTPEGRISNLTRPISKLVMLEAATNRKPNENVIDEMQPVVHNKLDDIPMIRFVDDDDVQQIRT